MGATMSGFILLCLFIGICVYFFPASIAVNRKAAQQAGDRSLQPVPRLDVSRMGRSTHLNLTFGRNILRRKGAVEV
jgi:hypothetical protein